MTAQTSARPRFSIVTAVYNVERYLDDFIASLEAQTFDLAGVEIIAVDDGSTDSSLARLHTWERSRPGLVTVLHKENGGQSSARNLGMQHARGELVTFPDPDDVLEETYLAQVDTFIRRNPSVRMVATRRVLFSDGTKIFRRHPLHMHFTRTNRLRNLDINSGHFHGSAPCAFFWLDELRRQALTFDDRIKPSFEDGEFCCRYLLGVGVPWVGFVRSAEYQYRKRVDGSSTLDRSWTDPRRYLDEVGFGFLALLRDAAAERGAVPGWLQSMVLYELSWYFKVEDAMPWRSTAAHGEVARQFNELLAEIVGYFDPRIVVAYPNNRLTSVYRDILAHGYSGRDWHAEYALVDKVDSRQKTLRLRLRFAGSRPNIRYLVGGADVTPMTTKIRAYHYFERDVLFELIAWLPLDTVEVEIDGRSIDTLLEEPAQPSPRLDSWTTRTALDPVTRDRVAPSEPRTRLRDRLTLRAAGSRVVRRVFRRSWVLIDRVHNADDSAEHLFGYLRRHQKGVNAWFVLESGTPDWKRLRRDHPVRLVPHGSLRWKLLMLNAEHLISSHVDQEISGPGEVVRIRQPRWRFTFLQHGVIKDDVSRWMNRKDVDLFVTSTPGEYASIVEDGSPYQLTSREVRLTGLPRFDKLAATENDYPPDKRDLILIAPTWRTWLMRQSTGTHRQNADMDTLRASPFLDNWMQVLRSEDLRRAAREHGARIALLPHPNLQSVAGELDLPEDVEVLDFEGSDAAELFARAKVFVTDYSSMAFNAAYIDRPVVYFQFDADEFFGGGHAGRSGYFDFGRDGFGPVAEKPTEVVAAVDDALRHGPGPQEPYARRIRDTFPLRDGRCSERVYQAIAQSTKRVKGAGWAVDVATGAGDVEPLPAVEIVDDEDAEVDTVRALGSQSADEQVDVSDG